MHLYKISKENPKYSKEIFKFQRILLIHGSETSNFKY